MTTDRYDPGPDARCPYIPEGATRWESQEIRRRWRNALNALDEVQHGMNASADRLLNRGTRRVPESELRLDHHVQGGGITYYAMQAEAEMVALSRVVDGCVHRLSMQEDVLSP